VGGRVPEGLTVRAITAGDMESLEACLQQVALFTPTQRAIALEAFSAAAAGEADHLTCGLFSAEGALRGGSCFGPVPASQGAYVVYWLFVEPAWRRRGLGRLLIEFVEATARAAGGHMVVAETAGRPSYAGTRAFWAACGFREEAHLDDFYGPGDSVLFFVKRGP
jgi:GNAT superfamily N-acetyltransferase